ncbi:MAG: hypothetical protein WKF30_02345 [Pyrinomonadaceae bacterium]
MAVNYADVLGDLTQTIIRHWLKVNGLQHSGSGAGDLYKLLDKHVEAGKISVNQLRQLVIEVEEHRNKRVYLGFLEGYKGLDSQKAFEKHIGSLNIRLSDEPKRGIIQPSKPTLNYVCWSPRG